VGTLAWGAAGFHDGLLAPGPMAGLLGGFIIRMHERNCATTENPLIQAPKYRHSGMSNSSPTKLKWISDSRQGQNDGKWQRALHEIV